MSTTRNMTPEALAEYSDEKRLAIYKMATQACTHLFSKGKLQMDKFNTISPILAGLAKHDPLFMAHFTAWAAKGDSKDMKTLAIFFNALSDADGTPFFKGATRNKPNLRAVSYAMLQETDPHLALRILELCHIRFGYEGLLNTAKHFPTGFKTAYKKYLKYREHNPDMLRGIRRAGLGQKMAQIYRLTHTAPSDDAASILNWKQKDRPDIKMVAMPDFEKKTSAEIAEEITNRRMAPMVALSVIPKDKITTEVAKALLENCTGNQSIILYNWFSRNGFLDVASIQTVFKRKVGQATTAVDRIDTLTKNADASDKKQMAEIRSERRKEVAKTGGLGKIYLHIDASQSMHAAIEFAKERAAIIAECVTDPQKNFRWGLFGTKGIPLAIPNGFTKEDFHEALYGHTANMGSTDCIALYKEAREFGADIDIYITDQGHNAGAMVPRIEMIHSQNPKFTKPKTAVIVDFSGNRNARVLNALEDSLKRAGIPTVAIQPESLTESALIAQSVRAAMIGELAIINEIMDTPLPKLPKWYDEV